jgi:hypothetical protein
LFHDLFVSDQSDDRHDDLLFFVQRIPDEVENGGLGVDPVFVKRKVKGTVERDILTPEQEEVVLWKDTFFLNVIVQVLLVFAFFFLFVPYGRPFLWH